MYRAHPNDEARLLVTHMQEPLCTVFTMVVHNANRYNAIFEKIPLCELRKKVEQNFPDGLVSARLDI